MNKIIPMLVASVLLVLGQCRSQAQSTTVNFSGAGAERNVHYGADIPVPDGNYVKIGTFDAGFDVASNADNPAALAVAWREYGFATTVTLLGETGSFAGMSSSPSTVFDSQQIYLWIFKTLLDGIPEPGFTNVTDYGLFTSANSAWRFPVVGTPPPGNTTTINSSQVDQALWGTFNTDHLYLAPVPEPSTFALMAIGCGVLLIHVLRRRR